MIDRIRQLFGRGGNDQSKSVPEIPHDKLGFPETPLAIHSKDKFTLTGIIPGLGEFTVHTEKAHRPYQQDGFVIMPDGTIWVIDGMGGMGEIENAGGVSCQCMTEAILGNPNSTHADILLSAQTKMKEKNVGEGGVCYAKMKISPDGIAEINQAGNCRVVILDKNEKEKFTTSDEEVIEELGGGRFHYPVTRAVTGKKVDDGANHQIRLARGDIILLMTDGVSGALTNQAYAAADEQNQILQTLVKNKSPEMAVATILDHIQVRPTYSDNATLVILRWNPPESSTETKELPAVIL